jgi:steroid delta-isomerase-like uncharacterized protein
MSTLDKRTLLRLMEAIWNERRLEVVDEIVASDYVRHDPAFPGEVRGPEGFKQYVMAMCTPFPDARISIEDVIAEGDRMAVRWIFRGKHSGEFLGIPATGKNLALTGISIIRIREGKIVEGWDGYDALGMLRQLGVAT